MDIAQVAQFGVAGMAVFLMYRIAANHIDHNTAVLAELKDAINKLTEFLQKIREGIDISSTAFATENRFNRNQAAKESRFRRSQKSIEDRFKRTQINTKNRKRVKLKK